MVDSIKDAGKRVKWVAALVGGCITTPSRGCYMVYEKGLRLRRILWVSDGFQAASPTTYNIIRYLVNQPGGRWKLAASFGEFAHVYGLRPQRKRHELIGLCTVVEKSELAPGGCSCNVFVEKELLGKVAVLMMKGSVFS